MAETETITLQLSSADVEHLIAALEAFHSARGELPPAELWRVLKERVLALPKAGEVRAVSGGHGLMMVAPQIVDEATMRMTASAFPGTLAIAMIGHGSPANAGANRWHWFPLYRLSAPVSPHVVCREQAEAAVRNVSCDTPDCWCIEVRRKALVP